MKLATFAPKGGVPRLGLVSRDISSMLDVKAAATELLGRGDHSEFADMQAIIDSGDAGLEKMNDLGERAASQEKSWHPLNEISLLAPLPEPRQIRDFAGFHDHLFDGAQGLLRIRARELGESEPARPSRLNEAIEKYPLFYIGNRLNVAGHDSHVVWPADVNLLDFELEIGACIGRTGKNIPRDQAEKHIFGYTIFNDVSARDLQSRQMPGGMGPCKAKSHDGCNVLGPWIVTRDEMPSPYGKTARVRVNGETWVETKAKATDVLHDFPEMIEFTSKGETIFAGEIFGSGTVSGCCGLEMDRWIKKGDSVELEFEGIGTLRNRYE